jgi:hypothetical protein
MKTYTVVKYNGGGWDTVEKFVVTVEDLDLESGDEMGRALEKYEQTIEENRDVIVGLMVHQRRKPAFMLFRSDWQG